MNPRIELYHQKLANKKQGYLNSLAKFAYEYKQALDNDFFGSDWSKQRQLRKLSLFIDEYGRLYRQAEN